MYGTGKFITILLGCTCAAMFALQISASGVYKWVDDDGNVHYSDRVPPEHARQDREVISPRGITLERIEGEKSAEQRAAEEARMEQRAREQSKREQQVRRDRMIRDSYASEEDIINARDTRLEAIEHLINMARDRIEVLESRLQELEERRQGHEAANREISDNLLEQIQVTRNGIENHQDYIERYQAELEETRAGYQTDLERFRELREMGRI